MKGQFGETFGTIMVLIFITSFLAFVSYVVFDSQADDRIQRIEIESLEQKRDHGLMVNKTLMLELIGQQRRFIKILQKENELLGG